LTDLVAKYPGTAEGSYAAIYLATDAPTAAICPTPSSAIAK